MNLKLELITKELELNATEHHADTTQQTLNL